MDRVEVKGPNNRRVVELRRLIDGVGANSAEIVLEGERTVGEALDAGLRLTTVIVPESTVISAKSTGPKSTGDMFAGSTLRERLDDTVEILVLRDRTFERLAPSVAPQPMLAVVPRPQAQIPTGFDADDFAIVLVGVADPGNVGTLIRVADATGAACVVVVGGADPWRPKAVRSSAGSVLRVPVVSGTDVGSSLSQLRAAGAKIVATDVREGIPHHSGVLNGPLAIVLGSESHGLDRAIDSLVDAWVRIDMAGNAESLNVAMAGTLLAYEASRSASSG
ncbi:MAG: RNA methyltransferase [Acidimicrobiaceae bacterium]|nr:RNA methyltransferase [Acidimicrobiaceae bacterium]MYC43750.1 RNA methyltransferase [Acidimicrobiaceae bacterium]